MRFNTQPPEGGWFLPIFEILSVAGFNTQPPEGGWFAKLLERLQFQQVSTHSRPKAAGLGCTFYHVLKISFNTQPPEGGWY